jgi:polyribonucleotide nucleotidyltransferase
MVESGSNEIDEETMIAALQFGHEAIQPIVATQLEMAQAMGKAKRDVQLFTLDESLVEKVSHRIADEINEALDAPHSKHELQDAIDTLRDNVVVEYTDPEDEEQIAAYKEAFEETYKRVVCLTDS